MKTEETITINEMSQHFFNQILQTNAMRNIWGTGKEKINVDTGACRGLKVEPPSVL